MESRNRYRLIAWPLLFAVGVAVGVSGVWLTTRHVPDFYEETLARETRVDPVLRRREAEQLVRQTHQLAEEIHEADRWSERFTQSQVNSWLAEELHREVPRLQREGVRDPRVQFSEGLVRIAFRLERHEWSGVVSLELTPSAAATNRLDLHVGSLRAGLIPIPLEKVLQEMANRFRPIGWTWRLDRIDGRELVTIEWPAAGTDEPILEQVEVGDGWLSISGRRETAKSPPLHLGANRRDIHAGMN